MAFAAAAFSAIGGIIQAGALAQQAAAQQEIAEFNAQRQEEEAARAQAAGQFEAGQRRKEARKLAASARAALAQGGVVTTTGSAGSLLQEITKEGELNAAIEVSNANAERKRRIDEAAATRFEGEVRAAGTRAQATASLLSGFGGFAKAFG